MYRSVPLTMLSEGLVLASGIHDQERRLLLAAGVPVTRDLVVGLHKRGVRSVVVTEKDLQLVTSFRAHGKARNAMPHRKSATCDLHCEASRNLDAWLDGMDGADIVPSEDPFSARLRSPGATPYDRKKMEEVFRQHQQSVDQVRNLLGQLAQNHDVAADAVQRVSRSSLMQAADDLDLFVCMGINPSTDNSIFAHSANTATLAVGVGATLGLDESTLCDLGTGCLVHDAGMLHIDQRIVQADHVLTPSEFVEIAKHPIIAADLLYRNMKQVPNSVRSIVYQMHERCDGSGYPRGTLGGRIHPLAKVAAVADAYVALVSARPHRPALLPYHAMTRMLQDVAAGLFDPTAVRGLLHAVSLFPIGSFVELNDGRVGKTVRANGPAYDRPIVEAFVPNRRHEPPEIVDLTERPDLRVVRPLTSLS